MSWDAAEKKAASVGKFISLKDGDSVTVAILGEPVEYTGKYGLRFRLNAIDPTGGEPKILEVSATTLKAIAAHKPKLATHAFTLTRSGEGTGTVYTFTEARALTDAEKTGLAQVPLLDLEDKPAPAAGASAVPF